VFEDEDQLYSGTIHVDEETELYSFDQDRTNIRLGFPALYKTYNVNNKKIRLCILVFRGISNLNNQWGAVNLLVLSARL